MGEGAKLCELSKHLLECFHRYVSTFCSFLSRIVDRLCSKINYYNAKFAMVTLEINITLLDEFIMEPADFLNKILEVKQKEEEFRG